MKDHCTEKKSFTSRISSVNVSPAHQQSFILKQCLLVRKSFWFSVKSVSKFSPSDSILAQAIFG